MNVSDEFEVCPYNKAHLIIRARMPMHLAKCFKHYQGEPLVACPFNFAHKVVKSGLKEHFKTCIDYYINKEGDVVSELKART